MIKEYIIKIDEDQDKKDIHGGYPLIEPPLELVRCKDCKHFAETQMGKQREENRRYVCDEFNPADDWYCADGERR